jgi:hypothetical protein
MTAPLSFTTGAWFVKPNEARATHQPIDGRPSGSGTSIIEAVS